VIKFYLRGIGKMRPENTEETNNLNGNLNHSNKVDLNHLMQRVRDQEKKSKRSEVVIAAAVLSGVVAFGIVLTL
tara:strand:+ start:191 stop:412 length:222 start_codon:yes stop_codon:yes gene_type:complete